MNKCTGQKADGSQCPKTGSCKSFQMGDASLTMQAPFTINESGQFSCSSFTMMTEQNLGGADMGDNQLLGS